VKRTQQCSALAIAFAIFLVHVAGCSDKTVLPALPADGVILAFGDSLTQGTGANPQESYPAVLETLADRRVVNAGKRGEESDAGVSRLPAILTQVRPDLVILGHGGNDILRKRDLNRTEDNLQQMVDMVRERGASVVLLGIPNVGIFLSSHPMYTRLSEKLEVPLEEDAVSDILGDGDLKSDSIHPNAAGYRRLAEAVHRLLLEHGAL
jgi:lysophospholipase L1-like esterase